MDNKNCDGLEKTAVKILFHYIEEYLITVESFPVKNVAGKKYCLNRYIAKKWEFFFAKIWKRLGQTFNFHTVINVLGVISYIEMLWKGYGIDINFLGAYNTIRNHVNQNGQSKVIMLSA